MSDKPNLSRLLDGVVEEAQKHRTELRDSLLPIAKTSDKHIAALIDLATAQAARIAGLETERDENAQDAYMMGKWKRDKEAAETALAAMTKERDDWKSAYKNVHKEFAASDIRQGREIRKLKAQIAALEGMEKEAHFHIKLWGKAQKEVDRLRVALMDLTKAFAEKVDVNSHKYRMPYEHPLSAYDRAVDVLASPYKEEKK